MTIKPSFCFGLQSLALKKSRNICRNTVEAFRGFPSNAFYNEAGNRIQNKCAINHININGFCHDIKALELTKIRLSMSQLLIQCFIDVSI